MKLTVDTYLTDENEFLANKYFIDGNEITEEDYYEILDADKIDECDYCDCSECDCCDSENSYEEEFTYDEENEDREGFVFDNEEDANEFINIVNEYITLIKATQGCPECIRELLVDFLLDIMDTFNYTDIEE